MPNKTFLTPAGIAVYPRLNEPDYKFNPLGVFSLRLRVAKQDAVSMIKIIEDLRAAEVKDQEKKLRVKAVKLADLPFKDVVDDQGNPTEFTEIKMKLPYEVNTKSGKSWTQRPALYDGNLKPLKKDLIIGSGSKLIVSFEPYPFYVASVGCGVSLRIRAVQVLDLVVGGQASPEQQGFTAVESPDLSEATSVVQGTDQPASQVGGNF